MAEKACSIQVEPWGDWYVFSCHAMDIPQAKAGLRGLELLVVWCLSSFPRRLPQPFEADSWAFMKSECNLVLSLASGSAMESISTSLLEDNST